MCVRESEAATYTSEETPIIISRDLILKIAKLRERGSENDHTMIHGIHIVAIQMQYPFCAVT